jgi:aspartate racemase
MIHPDFQTISRFTMSEDFIQGRLARGYQVETIVPTAPDQSEIQDRIYQELSVGVFDDGTREFFLQVIDSLSARGARAIILGCTEFPLLLRGADRPIPMIDSLQCHCEAISRYILDAGSPEPSPAGSLC